MKAWQAAALAVAAVLLRFPPERYAFYPRCPIHEAFGLLCPGCGATRAAAALLHGHPLDALRLNALFVIAVIFGLLCAHARWRNGSWPETRKWAVASALAAAILFGAARNVV